MWLIIALALGFTGWVFYAPGLMIAWTAHRLAQWWSPFIYLTYLGLPFMYVGAWFFERVRRLKEVT